jgi:restriction system protein
MASRKKKQQEARQQLLALVIIGIAVGAFLLTGSLAFSVVSLFVLLAGLTIWVFYINHKREERIRKSGIQDVDLMDGIQFERYLVVLFKQLGYKVQTTPSTNDYGLILYLMGEKVKLLSKPNDIRTMWELKQYRKLSQLRLIILRIGHGL